MEYTLEPTITKKLILSLTSEESIMEHYLGVPVKKGLFKSPLRSDSHPTCAFYRNKNGDLIFKDFRGDFSGNFVGVVMYKYNCNCGEALRIIANDFNIINTNIEKHPPLVTYSNVKFKSTEPSIIQVEIKDFSLNELKYWESYGISKQTLQKYQVYSCKNVFLNGKLFSLYKENQLIFGYFGGIKDNSEQWRIYYPGKKKYKFISNWRSTQIQGSKQIPKSGDIIVVTKSLKDVMTIAECSSLPAIAPTTENTFITDAQYKSLLKRFKRIVVFYDNDLAGISNMNKIRKKYPGVKTIFIPKKYKCKDISDFYKKYGLDKTCDLISEALNYINNTCLGQQNTVEQKDIVMSNELQKN